MPRLKPTPVPPGAHDRILEQVGVVTRRQLTASGVTRSHIEAQVRSGRWRQINSEVVITHNGPLTPQQREWATLLSAPDPSALCGLTSATKAGLRGFESSAVHVLVERGAKVLPLPGIEVIVHESRRFSANDILGLLEPRRVSTPRSIIDAASWTRAPLHASRILAAGVQQRLVTHGQLRGELDGAGRIRHGRMFRLLINDFEGGAQALSEVEFLRYCRRHRLPIPQMNVRCDRTGRRRYLDALLTRRDGSLLPVEIDGSIHLTLRQRADDDLRDNEYFIVGQPRGLRFASVLIYANDPRPADQIRRALGR